MTKKIGNSIFRFEQQAGIDSPLGNWRKRIHSKTEKKILNEEENRFDFLPIVKINKSEDAKNAIISSKECKIHKKPKLNLGSDYDKKYQEYVIPDIVIAKNSIAKIPLRIKRGYDPWGLQDNDGILEFKCSNNSVKMDFVNSDDTDYKTDKDKYNVKKATYGDEFIMEINAKALARGTLFNIQVYASDDNDFFSSKSNRKGICGKFNLKVVEKDVFMKEEIDIYLKENQNSLNNHTKCFIAVDNQFSKVVNNQNLKLNSYADLTGLDRINDYSKKGYVYSSKKFHQEVIWSRVDNDEYKLIPISFKNGKETIFSNYIKLDTSNKIGFHLYYFTLLHAYHVLSIVIDNSEPCDIKYKILDQIHDRAWRPVDNLDNDILNMTRRNYIGACNDAERKDYNSSVQLWKLQRK